MKQQREQISTQVQNHFENHNQKQLQEVDQILKADKQKKLLEQEKAHLLREKEEIAKEYEKKLQLKKEMVMERDRTITS